MLFPVLFSSSMPLKVCMKIRFSTCWDPWRSVAKFYLLVVAVSCWPGFCLQVSGIRACKPGTLEHRCSRELLAVEASALWDASSVRKFSLSVLPVLWQPGTWAFPQVFFPASGRLCPHAILLFVVVNSFAVYNFTSIDNNVLLWRHT